MSARITPNTGSENNTERFWLEKLSDFLTTYREISTASDLVQFDPKSLDTYKITDGFADCDQCLFNPMVEGFLYDLTRSANEIKRGTKRLKAWSQVLKSCGESEKISLLFEFVDRDATIALNLPYAIKQRFYFATAHLSHQANRYRNRQGWKDDASTLPNDRKIKRHHAEQRSSGWRCAAQLLATLKVVDDKIFQDETQNFRHVYSHRYTPSIETGMSRFIGRNIHDGKTFYTWFGPNALPLDRLIDALSRQCAASAHALDAFKELVVEQKEFIESTQSEARTGK